MNRVFFFAVRALILVIFATLALMLYVKWSHDWSLETEERQAKRSLLQQKLLHAMPQSGKNPQATVVNLAAITDFSWDRVYLFGPYSPPSYIYRQIGYHWYNDVVNHIQYLDDHSLLVFVQKGKVVEYLENPLGIGGMYWDTDRFMFERDDSKFLVSRELVDPDQGSVDPNEAIAPGKKPASTGTDIFYRLHYMKKNERGVQ
ncbi:hypothetical protein EDM56_25685 [Brevibacillus fluminis]|uniref:Uncharacterized protein n=1 Tax=Brevibacillus fluminis TaxID=511487 RepID=A0A3M8CZ37_9BACL|nr:hypothetical protein [Brevibacillus fluminis]RNB81122.1 hypothetical protein EDM56_25685 [Brevibacillus fluminis]